MTRQTTQKLNFANITLHRARLPELPSVQSLLEECATQLRMTHGLGVWGIATTTRQLERQTNSSHIMLVQYMGVTVATYTLTKVTPHWVTTGVFDDDSLTAIYLSDFVVMPSFRLRGVGRWCVGKAEEAARSQGATVLRTAIYTQLDDSMTFALTVGFLPAVSDSHPDRTYLEKQVARSGER
jgi:GNAT superfamily N-acetyltransferase